MMHSGRPAAFTLIELLAVIAVMAIVAAMTIPAISHTMAASRLTTAGQMVVDELNSARQAAISRNIPVEVRFYKLPAHNAPTTSVPAQFRAMQSFLVDGTNIIAVDRVKFFTAPVVVSTGNDESPFFSSLKHPEQEPVSISVPGYQEDYRYRAFRFTTKGAADIDATANFFTLVPREAAGSSLGQNFFTIQINPVAGAVRVFRP